ncbi:MAG: S-layer homology domain-containing protein [Tissierellia bacterium]|nr:S-layer homology domain-containing protein [Tissierellia bacterium]
MKTRLFSIADEYDTEHDKVFEVESGYIITILGTLDTYPAIKLFKNIFYHFDSFGDLDYIPASGFKSEFEAKLIIPKGIDVIDSTIEGIKKSLKYEMNNNSTMYEIKDVKYEGGFADGSKEITIIFGLTESYANKNLKDLETEINNALSGNVKQSLDNYLYMIDNLKINNKAGKYNSIELKVSGDTIFELPCDPGCGENMSLKYSYFGAQTDEGRDAHYPQEKNKIFLTVGTDKDDEKPSEGGGSGGSGGGGWIGFNTKEHFAYLVGYPDGTIRPNDKITRGEVTTIFFRMMSDSSRRTNWKTTNSFNDVKGTDWYNNAISTLSNAGGVIGYPDGSFKPEANMTRGEFATMASRFLKDSGYLTDSKFIDVNGYWAEDSINKLSSMGLIKGYEDGSFKPNQEITRAEVATLMNAVLDRTPHKDYMLNSMKKWSDNSNTNSWYYAQIQEATNSHEFERSNVNNRERWTKILPVRDGVALEKTWSNIR